MKNIVTYENYYRDIITFEQNDDKITMSGGKWLGYSFCNDYTEVYKKYCEDELNPIPLHLFEDKIHSDDVISVKYRNSVESTNKLYSINPSGGPYIDLKSNIGALFPGLKGIVDKIELIKDNPNINCIFTVKYYEDNK